MRVGVKLRGIASIIRAHNCASAFLAVLAGCYLGGLKNWEQGLVAATAAFLIVAGADSINDFFDIHIDEINRPTRPLPAGLLKPRDALAITMVTWLASLVLSSAVNELAVILALMAIALSFSYSKILKRIPALGNMVVSFLSALTILYGGATAGNYIPTLVPAMLIFLFVLAREILKTVTDVKGDATAGVMTLTMILGKPAVLLVYNALCLCVVLLSVFPYLFGLYSLAYLIAVVVGVDSVLLGSIFLLHKRDDDGTISLALRLTKASFFFGVFAFFLKG